MRPSPFGTSAFAKKTEGLGESRASPKPLKSRTILSYIESLRRSGLRTLAATLILVNQMGCAAAEPKAVRSHRNGDVVFLTNGIITAGVDLSKGGSLVLLAEKGGKNLINNHDLGRQVQASFYSGPKPYGTAAPQWKGWNWNPIQSGDVYGNSSVVAAWRVEGGTIYTRVLPYQWALRKEVCECSFETWTTLKDNLVHIHTRLNNHRTDHNQYPATTQELPAVYTVGRLRHLVSYTGRSPFSGAATVNLPMTFPWSNWLATEGWSAYLDDAGRGLGVISPISQAFLGGFSGALREGGTNADETGYISPLSNEVLDHDIRFNSDVSLVVGTVDQIRSAARRIWSDKTRPDYVFSADRQHWWYQNTRDAGWPIHGGLKLSTEGADPQLLSPTRAFSAARVPVLNISAAFWGIENTAQIFWTAFTDRGFTEEHSLRFSVIPDGKPHIYSLAMAANLSWSGVITGLRFDPPSGPGSSMLLCAISWKTYNCQNKTKTMSTALKRR